MLDALLDRFGTQLGFDGLELWAFWLPEEMEHIIEQDLRDVKIGYRAKFIKTYGRISSGQDATSMSSSLREKSDYD
jgi:hypothetical protein